MAKDPSTWDKVMTILIFSIFVGICVGCYYGFKALEQVISDTKKNLSEKGYTITESGVSVKTNHRSRNYEEQGEAINLGIRKIWKNTAFNIPPILQRTKVAGSKHDKHSEEYERLHGGSK